MQPRVGDKIRLRVEGSFGSRGIIERIDGELLLVRVPDSGELQRIPLDAVLNYSLAARKAWQNMPSRQVGRPKGSRVCDRVSVTLRIDRDLWELFRLQEERGLIKERTRTINKWLREKLSSITSELSCP